MTPRNAENTVQTEPEKESGHSLSYACLFWPISRFFGKKGNIIRMGYDRLTCLYCAAILYSVPSRRPSEHTRLCRAFITRKACHRIFKFRQLSRLDSISCHRHMPITCLLLIFSSFFVSSKNRTYFLCTK